MSLNSAIEVTFNPTPDDYARAQQWVGRQALGHWYYTYLCLLLVCAIGVAFGFILLIDAAFAYGKGPMHEQALLGAAVFLLAGYLVAGLVGLTRRKLRRMLMIPGGLFLCQRTLTFGMDGISNRGGLIDMQIPWSHVMGVHEDKLLMYIRLEPAYTLFIPKRVMPNPDDQRQLKAFILEKLGKTAPQP